MCFRNQKWEPVAKPRQITIDHFRLKENRSTMTGPNENQSFPYQQWWIAGYSAEIGREIVGRTILGMRVILYRTESGDAVAFDGHCPHRAYPLEKGTLVGDAVQCGYHGYTFDSSGSCIRIPSQSDVQPNSWLRRFPTEERGGLVWIWTGDAESADASLLPDLEEIGLSSDWCIDPSPLVTIGGRYGLLIDNLMDLSHASFIHADTIPGAAAIANTPAEIIEGAGTLNVQRIGRDLPSNPFFQLLFPEHSDNVDQHFDAEYLGPCLIRTGGALLSSQSGKELGRLNFVHGITPETEASVHYWVMTTRNFQLNNEAITHANLAMGDRIQPQDIDAIESIEAILQSMSTLPKEVSGQVDVGAIKVRRLLAHQIRSEA